MQDRLLRAYRMRLSMQAFSLRGYVSFPFARQYTWIFLSRDLVGKGIVLVSGWIRTMTSFELLNHKFSASARLQIVCTFRKISENCPLNLSFPLVSLQDDWTVFTNKLPFQSSVNLWQTTGFRRAEKNTWFSGESVAKHTKSTSAVGKKPVFPQAGLVFIRSQPVTTRDFWCVPS